MRIGYARVSTQDQTLALQLDALKAAECERIYQEKASGKNAERPELQACLATLRKGDVLVVWRLDRLGRSLKDLVNIASDVEAIGAEFVSLTEKIDTSSGTGKVMFGMFAVFAAFERDLIRERTMAGLAAGRARGRKGGAPSKTTPAQRNAILALYKDKTVPIADITKQYRISKTTLHRIVKAGK